ncbi:hypothetical protein Tco_0238479 [Tanacetum coccineum]
MVEQGRNFDTKYRILQTEQEMCRLGLAADGFNPFANLMSGQGNIDVYVAFDEEPKVIWDWNKVSRLRRCKGQKFNLRAMFYGPSMIFLRSLFG